MIGQRPRTKSTWTGVKLTGILPSNNREAGDRIPLLGIATH